MALKPFYKNADEIPSDLAQAYVRNEELGLHVLAVEAVDGWSLENVRSLKDTLAKVNAKNRDAVRRLREFGDVEETSEGLQFDAKFDPAKYQDAIDAAERAKGGDKDGAADKVREEYEAKLTKLREDNEKAVADKDRVISERDGSIHEMVVRERAAKVFAKHKVDPDVFMPHVLGVAQVKRVEEDDGRGGKTVKYVDTIHENGVEVISDKENSTDPMGVEEFITGRLAKKFADHWPANTPKGSDLRDGNRTPTSSNGYDLSNPRAMLAAHHEQKAGAAG